MTDEEKFAEARAGAHGAVDDLFDNLEGANKLIGELVAALKTLTNLYVALVNTGDCGRWDPETDPEIIAARAALSKVKEV